MRTEPLEVPVSLVRVFFRHEFPMWLVRTTEEGDNASPDAGWLFDTEVQAHGYAKWLLTEGHGPDLLTIEDWSTIHAYYHRRFGAKADEWGMVDCDPYCPERTHVG